jgi:hypothetical protein
MSVTNDSAPSYDQPVPTGLEFRNLLGPPNNYVTVPRDAYSNRGVGERAGYCVWFFDCRVRCGLHKGEKDTELAQKFVQL